MNLLFFLIPKSEISYITDDVSIRTAMGLMERHGYSAVPVLNKKGKYIGTLTEGDILWGIKNNYSKRMDELDKISITQLPRKKDNQPVYVNTTIESLISKATSQNFIPVIDDDENFIGIVTRKDIIQYCYKKISK